MKNRNLKTVISIGLVCVSLLACAPRQTPGNEQSPKTTQATEQNLKTEAKGQIGTEGKKNKGKTLEDFTLSDLEGKEVSSASLAGKKVYLQFWASWCPICLSTLAKTDQFSKETHDFEVLTVVAPGYANEKNKEEFLAWFKSLGYDNIKVLFDEKGASLVSKLGVRGYPTSVFIGSDGVVAYQQAGHMEDGEILKKMSAIY